MATAADSHITHFWVAAAILEYISELHISLLNQYIHLKYDIIHHVVKSFRFFQIVHILHLLYIILR